MFIRVPFVKSLVLFTIMATSLAQADPLLQSPSIVLSMSVLNVPISMNAKRSAIRRTVGWPLSEDLKVEDILRDEHYLSLRSLAPQYLKEWVDYLSIFGLRFGLSDLEIQDYKEYNLKPVLGENSSIVALDLSRSAYFVLSGLQVNLVKDVRAVSVADLRRVNGGGNSTVNEIVERFHQFGIVIPERKFNSDSLDNVGLSPLALRTLWSLGISTISELPNLTDEALYNSAGKKTIQEIVELLKRHNIFIHIDPTTDFSLYRAGLNFREVSALQALGAYRLIDTHKISIKDLSFPQFQLRKDSVQRIRRLLFKAGYPLRRETCHDLMREELNVVTHH